MQQGRIFPLHIKRLEPATFGTTDCHWTGVGEDGLCYVLKRLSDGPLIPAAEWICGSLAKRCNLPIPPFEIAELPDGERLFASRWEGGLLPYDRAVLEPRSGSCAHIAQALDPPCYSKKVLITNQVTTHFFLIRKSNQYLTLCTHAQPPDLG